MRRSKLIRPPPPQSERKKTMSDDKRPKRAPLPAPPHQRSKKRKIDVNPEEHTLSEILPTTQAISHDQVRATFSEPTNLEHDTVRIVGHTKSQSVDSTLPSQSEYSLPTLTSHTESSHQTPNPTCKYNNLCPLIVPIILLFCGY